MPPDLRSPLEGIDRLLVDATNLLHALNRGSAPSPPAALVGRLRAVVPPEVSIELVFDGVDGPGMRGVRIASGVIVRYSGRQTADAVLAALVDEARNVTGSRAGADNILVVSDDRDLRHAVSQRGARTARTAWLIARLERTSLSAPSSGNPRPPRSDADRQGGSARDEERTPWKPGRGSTTKRGNPKRRPLRRGGS